jgi:hypothetical protein
MKQKILSSLLVAITVSTFSASAMAVNLTPTLSGSGCVVTNGDYADTVLGFTAADLVAAHGTIAPGDTIIHSVTFTPNYGVTDASCADATVAIALDSATLPTTGSVSFNSIVISGAGTTASSIVNNTDPVTVTVTMTAQTGLGLASPFTYSIPIALSANVLGN